MTDFMLTINITHLMLFVAGIGLGIVLACCVLWNK